MCFLLFNLVFFYGLPIVPIMPIMRTILPIIIIMCVPIMPMIVHIVHAIMNIVLSLCDDYAYYDAYSYRHICAHDAYSYA